MSKTLVSVYLPCELADALHADAAAAGVSSSLFFGGVLAQRYPALTGTYYVPPLPPSTAPQPQPPQPIRMVAKPKPPQNETKAEMIARINRGG